MEYFFDQMLPETFRGSGAGGYFSVFHYHQMIGDLQGMVQVMERQDDGFLLSAELT